VDTARVVVTIQGSTIYSKDGTTGAVSSGSDAYTVIQTAVDAGDGIVFV